MWSSLEERPQASLERNGFSPFCLFGSYLIFIFICHLSPPGPPQSSVLCFHFFSFCTVGNHDLYNQRSSNSFGWRNEGTPDASTPQVKTSGEVGCCYYNGEDKAYLADSSHSCLFWTLPGYCTSMRCRYYYPCFTAEQTEAYVK